MQQRKFLAALVGTCFLPTEAALPEVAWSSSASQPNQASTQYLICAGVNYTAETCTVGVEALIPGNKQTGSQLGVVAQFHLYFDDLFPKSLGKPIVEWLR